ncbi:MAG: hypothetical protein WAZ77_18420 [Candidatus Nitrosopolaris sp.]|jgi:hypothetical protein
MLSNDEVKDILYSTIESIGNERIRSDTTSNINFSEKYIDAIMAECITKISVNSNSSNKDETIAVLCEALLHFMLTVSTLPSERKIQVKDNLTIDVVIPSLQRLKRTPDKSIIIEIIRNKMDSDKISQLEFLQPNHKNIWLISVTPFSTTRYRAYGMSTNTRLSHSFSNIIKDINNFLEETGDKSLRFIH